MADLWVQLEHDRLLTTAEILYFFPDYPTLLQQYLWQDYDRTPEFPCLRKFMQYWNTHLEGRVHSVRISAAAPLSAGGWKALPLETWL
jgi:uncharacterized protein Usg